MNQQLVSKTRAKKTKHRERKAKKENIWHIPIPENPIIGFVILLIVWASTLFFANFEFFLNHTIKTPETFNVISEGIILFTSLLATIIILCIIRPDIIKQNKYMLMLGIITIISIGLNKFIYHICITLGLLHPQIAQLILPIVIAPVLITLLLDDKTAVVIGIWTSFAICLFTNHSLFIFVNGIVLTAVTAKTIWRARSRSRIIKKGFAIGLCGVSYVCIITTLHPEQYEILTVFDMAGASIAGGVISTLLALAVLPLLETSFDTSTDITLLELSDLSHPLLQRLALEAPGTYHHSLIVANLAQAAADEIGANSLLARVASYFHDIGKIVKPDFFAENINARPNPHDNIAPSMSTLIISAHVKEGFSMAKHHKLPRSIINVISEHHGTSVMTFFHHKAKELQLAENADENNISSAEIDDSSFRYPGPKPSSKESAIICLADSIEAASRSIEKTQPSYIEGIVNDIIHAKVNDGQLDNSTLTFGELSIIKRSFIFTLTNMLHGRVPYPKNENQNKQSTKKNNNKSAGNNGNSRSSNAENGKTAA